MEVKYAIVENGDPGMLVLKSSEASCRRNPMWKAQLILVSVLHPGIQALESAMYFTCEVKKPFFCSVLCSIVFKHIPA